MNKRMTNEEREMILAEFNIGKSQNQLARDYHFSTSTINKICKGLAPKYVQSLENITATRSSLLNDNTYQTQCFEKSLTIRFKNLDLIHKLTELNLLDTKNKLLEGFSSIAENKIAQELIHKAGQSLGVIDQFAPKTIINNENLQDTKNLTVKFE